MYRLNLYGTFSLSGSDGSRVPLKSRKAQALLAYLALPPGRPRSREEIIALLWSDRGEAQARASLRQVLAGLRRDLGAEGAALLRIDGDSVALDPGQVDVAAPAGGELLSGLHVRDPAFEDWLRDERLRRESESEFDDPANLPDMAAKPSVVVMPFANLSDDPTQDYFSEGIAEDIATELSRFGLINVIARKTVFDLRNEGGEAASPLSDIRVDYLLEGTVRKAGTRIRLSARLIDRAHGKQVWADRFDRELDDIFALQDELVRIIVTRLIGRIEWHGSERALRKSPANLAAYDYYLQGLWYDRKYDLESLLAGRDVLRKAVRADPMFARAYGLLATFMMCIGWTSEASRDSPDAVLEFARKAVELDPTDASCISDLGVIYLDRGEPDEARRNLETAMRLNPHDPYVWTQYAWLLNVLSKPDRAIRYLDRALEADPHPPNWAWHIRAESLFALERYREAAELFERVPVETLDAPALIAACYGQLGEREKAAEHWSRYCRINPCGKLADVGKALAYVDEADAERWIEGLRKAGLRDCAGMTG